MCHQIDTLDTKVQINNLGGKTSLYLDLVKRFLNKYKVVYIRKKTPGKKNGFLKVILSIYSSIKSDIISLYWTFDLSLHCSELERNIQKQLSSVSKLLETSLNTKNLAYELEKV